MQFPYPHVFDHRPRLGPFELGPNDTPENGVYCGDFFQYADRIPDESVDLCFTDPVYWQIDDYRRLAEVCARVLKPDSALLVWQGQQWLDKTIIAMKDTSLNYRWVLSWYASNNMQMVGRIGRKIAPLLWYEKGNSNPITAIREVKECPIPNNKPIFKWAKRVEVVTYFINKFTKPDYIVLDCFTGSGVVPAACKQLGRRWMAFDIERNMVDISRQRLVKMTNPPLFVLPPQQARMEIA